MIPNPEDRDKAIQAAVTAMSAFRNYHRDPENGPFEGSEADWLWAEAERATDAVIAALSQAEPAPEDEYDRLERIMPAEWGR